MLGKRPRRWANIKPALLQNYDRYFVASELNDPICHSNECQIGSFSSAATIYWRHEVCVDLCVINSLSASLLLNIFLSFEVGIAHAIANFKWKENTSSLKN